MVDKVAWFLIRNLILGKLISLNYKNANLTARNSEGRLNDFEKSGLNGKFAISLLSKSVHACAFVQRK